jgi:hypothetical protein
MDENRNQVVFTTTTPTLKRRLDAYAKRNNWTRSTAAMILIERGLDAEGVTEDQEEPSA